MRDAPLNARIGRTLQGPMFGLLVPGIAAPHPDPLPVIGEREQELPLPHQRGGGGVLRSESLAPPQWQAHAGAWLRAGVRAHFTRITTHTAPQLRLLAILLLALWPHWVWMTRRLTDGSDEPWGIVALVTVLVLVARDRRQLALPSRHALLASAVLAVLAAIVLLAVPPIFAAGLAMLALAVFLGAALPLRPAMPLATLLLLALPIIASLQFYLGYPLRAFTAQAAAPLLQLLGIDAQAAGASLVWSGGTVLVDPPCAGIGMLWVGSFTAALLSYLNGADARRTLANGLVAATLVLVANVLRNAALFFPESGLVHWPDAAHRAVGLAAFALAIAPLAAFAQSRRT